MAINQQNPFVGIYSNPITEAKKKRMVGLSGPKDVVAGKEFLANGLWDLGSYNTPTSKITGVMPSSEEVIGRPDAQNTAQRSKSVSSGMKDAYDAVAKAKDLVPKQMSPQDEMREFDKIKQATFKKYSTIGRNPFSGEKAMAFDAAMGKGEITPKLQGIINANMAEFQAVSEIIDRNNNPQKYAKMGVMDMGLGGKELMPMGESRTKGQLGQSSTTGNRAAYGEKERTYLRPDEIAQRQAATTIKSIDNTRPIAAPTPRLDAMKAMNATSKPNALVPGTDFSGRTIQEKPKYGNGVYAPEYMDIYNSF